MDTVAEYIPRHEFFNRAYQSEWAAVARARIESCIEARRLAPPWADVEPGRHRADES